MAHAVPVIAADVVSMTLLVASVAVEGEAVAFPMLLLATAFLGLGFGVTLSCLSTFAGGFMPDRREVALTALNVLLGLGTALSPLLVALFIDFAEWWYLPLITGAGSQSSPSSLSRWPSWRRAS
jgi:MFS family permease